MRLKTNHKKKTLILYGRYSGGFFNCQANIHVIFRFKNIYQVVVQILFHMDNSVIHKNKSQLMKIPNNFLNIIYFFNISGEL